MVLIFEDPFEDNGDEFIRLDGEDGDRRIGGGGDGDGIRPPIEPEEPIDGRRIALLPVPTGQYRKTRHSPTLAFVNPVAGTGTNTEAQELIPGPTLDINISDRNAQYRIVGFFPFDNAEYDFTIIAPELFRVLLDGRAIIDDFKFGKTRTRIARVPVTAGNHQVEINFGFEPTFHRDCDLISLEFLTRDG